MQRRRIQNGRTDSHFTKASPQRVPVFAPKHELVVHVPCAVGFEGKTNRPFPESYAVARGNRPFSVVFRIQMRKQRAKDGCLELIDPAVDARSLAHIVGRPAVLPKLPGAGGERSVARDEHPPSPSPPRFFVG